MYGGRVKVTMKKKTNNNNNNNKKKHDAKDDDDDDDYDSIFWTNRSIIPPILIISVCIKIMLFPTYRSTDFDVHRNWLAITYNLPLSQWYFDDIDGQTVHTLDYPPNFAYFEYFLANNPITKHIFSFSTNDTCLDLLPDTNNEPSDLCIVFQRSTVIISDLILWIGAWIACTGMYNNNDNDNVHQYNNKTKSKSTKCSCVVKSFLLIVLNPGLIWLDHIHFQYNGMMLGILLASIGLLLHAANINNDNNKANLSYYHLFNLGGAVLYGILVNFKHLYLPLGPLYFVYLLKTYCLEEDHSNNNSNKLLVNRFMLLAVVTASTLILPWIPFLIVKEGETTSTAKEQVIQILSRLFPFGRGLVHDYWAANVWALYLLVDKVLRFVVSTTKVTFPLQSLPEPSPGQCAILLLTSMIPGLYLIWTKTTTIPTRSTTTSSSNISNKRLLIQGVVFCSLSSFMLAYHVHEKAILTALIPMTLLIEYDTDTISDNYDSEDGGRNKSNNRISNFLVLQVTIFGLLGLFPLLFRPVELSFKLVSYLVYITICCCWVKSSHILPKSTMMIIWQLLQRFSLLVVMTIIIILEFVPILQEGKYEFLPLMLTSTLCAVDLVLCWIVLYYVMYYNKKKKTHIIKTR